MAVIRSRLLVAMATGCLWATSTWAAPPPETECPFVARYDLSDARRPQDGPPPAQRLFDEIRIPATAPHRPVDPVVMLRSVEPPGGMYSNTVWSVAWKERDGRWWYWRQNRDPSVPPPPPAPPPGGWTEPPVYRPPTDEERWPPQTGALAPDLVKQVEEALAAPCRAWEPDIWPLNPRPKHAARKGADPPLPQDWTPTYTELTEEGRPPRRIAGPLNGRSWNSVLARIAYSPNPVR